MARPKYGRVYHHEEEWFGRCGRYGPIYAVSLGSVPGVVLNNMCTICDAFETKAHIFSDRPNWLPLICLIYQERGLLLNRSLYLHLGIIFRQNWGHCTAIQCNAIFV